MPATPSSTRLRGLDGLRGVAALAIFFHHVGFWSQATFTGFWGNYLGRLDIGVPVFFSLSGYLLFRPIATSVLDDRPLRPLREHLWRRALRIYPAFWVALTLIVALTSEEFRDTTGVVVTYLLIHIHWPTHVIGPMPQAWSLATEISFYLALPLLARLARPVLAGRPRDERRNGLFLLMAGLYALSVAFRVVVLGVDNRWTPAALLWLPANFDYFAIGMALAVAQVALPTGTRGRARLDRLAAPAGRWWLVGLVLFTAVSQWMGLALGLETASWPREMMRQATYGAIGFTLLFPLVFGTDRPSPVRAFVRSGPVDWLGTISYSFYLWHMVFIVHAWEPLDRLIDLPGHRFWELCLVAGIPTVVVSAVSYYTVERGGQRFQGVVAPPPVDPTPGESLVARAHAAMRSASFRAQLAVVAAIALVVRLGYLLIAKRGQGLDLDADIYPGDQFYYSLAADALADGKGFVVPWHETLSIPLGLAEPGSSAPSAADHPPLTALVATPVSFLPGEPGSHVMEQRLTMTVIGVAAVVVIGLLAREVAGRTVGLVAAGLAAVYPNLWVNDGLVMSESLTALMIAGALWAAVRYRRSPSWRVAAELGVWIGLASLARSESLLLVPLVVVPLVWVTHRTMAERVGRAAVTAVAVVVVISPWVVPNLFRFEEPVLMSTNDGLTLVGANNPQTYDGGALGFWTLQSAQDIDITGLDQSQSSRVYRDEAVEYITGHLDELPKVVVARLGRLWSLYEPRKMSDFNTGEGRERWVSNLAFVTFYPMAAVAAIGWWRLRRERVPTWTLTAMIVHASLIGALFYGIVRFRVPAEVAIVVFAAVGIRWLSSLATCSPKPTS